MDIVCVVLWSEWNFGRMDALHVISEKDPKQNSTWNEFASFKYI